MPSVLQGEVVEVVGKRYGTPLKRANASDGRETWMYEELIAS